MKSATRSHQHSEELNSQHSRELEQRIRERAFGLFQARGEEMGHDLEDWLRAEEEVMSGAVTHEPVAKDEEEILSAVA